jgi:hypothetical protein
LAPGAISLSKLSTTSFGGGVGFDDGPALPNRAKAVALNASAAVTSARAKTFLISFSNQS